MNAKAWFYGQSFNGATRVTAPATPRQESTGNAATTSVECECGHLEKSHAEADYDCAGDPPRYVADPRPCLVCPCKNFWSGE